MAEIAAMALSALEAMGQRGRVYGLQHFSKAEGVRRLIEVILSAKGYGAKGRASNWESDGNWPHTA